MTAASDTRLNRRSVAPASTSSLVSDTYSEVDFCELDETSGDVTPLAAGILSHKKKNRKHTASLYFSFLKYGARPQTFYLSLCYLLFSLKASCPLLE